MGRSPALELVRNGRIAVVVQSIFRAGPFAAVVLSCLGISAGEAIAQNYPTQPIKIIVATPPGGLADLVGRTFCRN